LTGMAEMLKLQDMCTTLVGESAGFQWNAFSRYRAEHVKLY
jgi:hypothetical protein